jgi:preprotein translocase subunit SecG
MNAYNYVTIASSLLMTLLILVQTRGASLGAGFGGGGEVVSVRRGSDKVIHQITIISAVIFAVSIVLGVVA